MLKLTRTGLGLLTRQYRSVLKKCWLINAGLFGLAAATMPSAALASTLADYITNSADASAAIYAMTQNESITGSLGAMVGTGYNLIVNGQYGDNQKYTVDGNGYAGINIGLGQTLSLYDVIFSNMANPFNNAGNLNLKNVEMVSNNWETTDSVNSSIIDNASTGVVSIEDSKFNNNSVTQKHNRFVGLFIDNKGHITQIVNAEVNYNTSTTRDAASSLWGGLISNGFGKDGGIYPSASIDLIRDSSFIGNTAHSTIAAPHGGVILNTGIIGTIDSVKFQDNVMYSDANQFGGAHGTVIDNNTDDIGVYGRIDKITNAVFKNNGVYRTGDETTTGNYHASASAIDNYGYIGEISNTVFEGNWSKSDASSTTGAIMSFYAPGGLGIIERFINVTFKNNSSYSKTIGATAGAMSIQNSSYIQADFSGNYAESDSGYAYGGAMYISAASNIGEIIGDFSDNYVKSVSKTAMGGAIYKVGAAEGYSGYIGSINGNFSNNRAESTYGQASGAAIVVGVRTTIDSIEGKFLNNYSSSGTTMVGGAFRMSGSGNAGAEVGTLSGLFEGNYGEGVTTANGGAIGANTASKIGDINANFINNHVKATGGDVKGGAIDTIGTIQIISGNSDAKYAGSVTGTGFIGNYALSEDGNAYGGAISNRYVRETSPGIINAITADFTNNYAQTTASGKSAQGGAIWNNNGATIGELSGSFTGNYAQSDSGEAQGGAIYNGASTIGISAANKDVYFYNNRVISGSTSRYNDIYNTGTINMNAGVDNSIVFNGSVEGADGTININTDGLVGGTYVFNNTVSGNSLTIGSSSATAQTTVKLGTAQQADSFVSYGTLSDVALTNYSENLLLDLRNQNIDTHSLTTLTLSNQMKLAIDARLNGSSGATDTITVSGDKTALAGSLIIDAINLDNTTYNSGGDKVTITLTTDSTLKEAYTLSDDILSNISGNNYYTSVTYNNSTGTLVFDDKLINRSTLDSILVNNYYRK